MTAAAAALVASPGPRANAAELSVVAGLPYVAFDANRAAAWRTIGVAARSEWIDGYATVASCIAPRANPSLDGQARQAGGCGEGVEAAAAFPVRPQFGLTFKLPRADDNAPLLDVALRRWSGTSPASSSGSEPRVGTLGGLLLAQPLGPLDLVASYWVPLGGAADAARSIQIGLAWYAGPQTTLELTADRSVDTATGVADRLLTLRLAHGGPSSRTRLTARIDRALDDPGGGLRIGAGIEHSF